MKKLLFFVNPNAGHAEIRMSLMEVLNVFAAAGYEITVHPTQGPGELTRVLREKGSGYDLVVSTGGDGTLNETVSGLMALHNRPLLGYIPGGTVNDVASTLGLSRTPLRAAKELIGGVPYAIDTGSFNDRWFTYVAAFGVFTDVSYRTSQQDKRALGRLAYLLDGVKSLSDIRPTRARVTVGGETVEDDFLVGLVTSTTSVGGFKVKNDIGISLNDGLFEVVLIRNIDNILLLSDVAAALLRGDFSHEYIYARQTDHVVFEFPKPVDWTLDGEFGGTVTRAEIKNHNRAVQILIPKREQ